MCDYDGPVDRRLVDKRFKFFDRTFGKFIRLFESSRIRLNPEPHGVRHRMVEMALNDSATFALNNFGDAQFFKSKSDLHYYCCEYFSSISENSSAFGEFGVYKGDSLNRFASLLPERIQIYGFDSFEGLPGEWTGSGMRKGAFSLGGVEPAINSRCKLVKGVFSESLPDFLMKSNVRFGMIHMDADLYISTKFVLESITRSLEKNAIIIFDEYFGYVNWRNHEHLALLEWSSSNGLEFKYLAYTDMQVVVQLRGH